MGYLGRAERAYCLLTTLAHQVHYWVLSGNSVLREVADMSMAKEKELVRDTSESHKGGVTCRDNRWG